MSRDWLRTVIFFEGTCAYCGKTMRKGERLTKDHLVPLSEGGTWALDNIIPSCRACNESKGSQEWREWYMQQPFFSQDRMNKIFKWRSIVRASGEVE